MRQAGWVLATGVAVFFFVINLYTMALLNLAVVALRDKGHGAETDGRVEYHQLTAHIFSRTTNAAFMFVALVGQLGTLASSQSQAILQLRVTSSERWRVTGLQ